MRAGGKHGGKEERGCAQHTVASRSRAGGRSGSGYQGWTRQGAGGYGMDKLAGVLLSVGKLGFTAALGHIGGVG